MNKKITKTTGDVESFSLEKLKESLERAGVEADMANDIARDVARDDELKTTVDVHNEAFARLKKKHRPTAARYNLKRALKGLGPSGYPFEQFFARLLDARGYKTSTNRTVRGRCVSHEIDVMGYKDKKHFIFECKFHNNLGYKSDVQTILYMKARFDDIRERWEQVHEGKDQHLHKLWVVTNTQFTSQAREYARCNSIGLMSWRYPHGHSLAELIDQTGLHPVTAITRMNRRQKDYLINHGTVLCREVVQKPHVLKKAGVHGHKFDQVVAEAKAIINLEILKK